MQDINFNPNGKPIHINIKTGGKVFISYTFTLAEGANELQVFSGNNDDPADDKFKLINQNNLNEPVALNHLRILDVGGLVNATEGELQPYSIIMEVFQCDTLNDLTNDSKIGEVKLASNVATAHGSIPFRDLLARLVKI